ncbi:MAG: tRNA (adenosine(37)-N6)-dimethylallyltransferase MiaA [Spirochaetota bacterium]
MGSAYNCIVIAGPTASGKTSLACAVAYELGGEILSADSRQVYRGMDIGTGKDIEEYEVNGRRIPYHLIDIADPVQTYTLYDYQRDFYRAFDDIIRREMVPVICGGSGLYLEAVLRKYRISSVPEDRDFRKRMMELDRVSLLFRLARYPDLYARTDISSRKRIVRALEIAAGMDKETPHGRQTAGRHTAGRHTAGPKTPLRPLVFVLLIEPDLLKRRIHDRLHRRLAEGMVEEVSSLLDAGVPCERMMMFGMEYRWITRYCTGEIDYETMTSSLERDIRRLAKRQRTWFRGMARRGISLRTLEFPDTDVVVSAFRAE